LVFDNNQAAAGVRTSGFGVVTPITSRYPSVAISASADGMTTKVAILSPKSGTKNWASTSR